MKTAIKYVVHGLSFCLISSLFFSCSREVADPNSITIRMPGGDDDSSLQSYVSENFALNLNSSVRTLIQQTVMPEDPNIPPSNSEEVQDWLSMMPTGYKNLATHGLRPINCFFVTVSLKDESDTHACYRINENANPNNPTVNVFSFAHIAGPVYAGQTTTMSVATLPGAGRDVRIYGTHVDRQSDCVSFTLPTFDRRQMTRPYFYAGKFDYTIVAGQTVNFEVTDRPAGFDSTHQQNYFDYCDSGTAGLGVSSQRTADHYEISLDTGIFKNSHTGLGQTGQCVKAKISLKDKSGLFNIFQTQSFPMELAEVDVSPNTPITLYESAYDCKIANPLQLNSFTGDSNYVIEKWIRLSGVAAVTPSKIDFNVSTKTNINASVANGGLGAGFASKTDLNDQIGHITSPTMSQLVLSVPEVVKNNACVPIMVARSPIGPYGFEILTSLNAGFSLEKIPNTGTQKVELSSASGCGSAVDIEANNPTIPFGSVFYQTLYLKFSGFNYGDKVKLTVSGGGGASSSHIIKYATGGLGGFTPTQLKISGPDVHYQKNTVPITVATCLGPYRISAADIDGVSTNKSGLNRTIQFNYQDTSEILIYNALNANQAPCLGSPSTIIYPKGGNGGIQESLNLGSDGTAFFYVSVLASNAYRVRLLAKDSTSGMTPLKPNFMTIDTNLDVTGLSGGPNEPDLSF